MKPSFRTLLSLVYGLVLASLSTSGASAATPGAQAGPHVRITAEISNTQQVRLKGSLHPLAQSRFDAGRLDGQKVLHGISLAFARSAEQQADLVKLMAQQQNPASPQYHRWLTPEQFAARFGIAQPDLDKASAWLQQQGFSIERTSRSRDRILFTGTVAQIEHAFSTQMHVYKISGKEHFAPSTVLSIPSALSGIVSNVGNLDSFRPHPMHTPVAPNFTSGTTGNHFLSPADVATIYDVKPLWNSGFTGKGQAIAIAGQSYVSVSDVEHFQLASGWSTPKDPQLVIIPGSGADGVVVSGDDIESDLDLEWAGTIAPGADIFFVYAGSGGNYSVFDAVAYAIEDRIAPIVSISYGACELAIGSESGIDSLESIFQQAAVQGQTLVASSGDDGASGCFRDENFDMSDRAALSVSYPASSAYFTGVGGTQFNEGSGTYWTNANGADVIDSALSYIPEITWNEDNPNYGLGSSGGGVSSFFTKPSWQAGVPGIPSDGARDTPDVALASAGVHDALLFCSSDPQSWAQDQGQVSSCTNGFRDATSGLLTASGGTSFATPIFAGMLALIDQQQNGTGLGLINPKLYALASDPGTYSSAFHDITTGDNRCDIPNDPDFCPNGATGYDAGIGYDVTTGLGSIDLASLGAAWGSSALAPTSITITPSTTAPASGAQVSFTVKVADAGGSGTPSGTVSILLDGDSISPDPTLSSGTATFSAQIVGEGTHVLVATYSGDGTYAASTQTIALPVPVTTTTIIATPTPKPLVGSTVNFSIYVQDASSSDNVTGTFSIVVDGTPATTLPVPGGALVSYSAIFNTAGTHTVQAVYSGSQYFATSTGVTTVNVMPVQVATTTAISASANSIVAGTPTPFTVTVKPATGTDAPAGTITVSIAGNALNPLPLVNGAASFNYTFQSPGTYLVQSVYTGSPTFTASNGTLKVTAGSVAPIASVTTITASDPKPEPGVSDTFAITVTSGGTASTATPTGTVAVSVDGVPIPSQIALTGGTAIYSTAFNTGGTHTVSAAYSGDATFTTSTASTAVSVPQGNFSLAGTSIQLQKGGSGTSTITLTPANGYTGTVAFTVSQAAGEISGLCLAAIPNASVSGSGAVTATLGVRDGEGSCAATSSVHGSTMKAQRPDSQFPLQLAFAIGLAGLGADVRRWRKAGVFLLLLGTLGIGMTMSACGGSSSPVVKPTTVSLAIIATDTARSSVTAQTTVNVTITQ